MECRAHWTLELGFNEDPCRVHVAHAAEHLAQIHRISPLLPKNKKSLHAEHQEQTS